jgi:hypothetical protein
MDDAMSQRLRAIDSLAPARVHRVGEARANFRVAISTKSWSDRPAYRELRKAGGRVASGIGRVVRTCGSPKHWRLVVLLVALSFLSANFVARALMAVFDDAWTEVALLSARHENQELRMRQEILREQTEAALARLAALEATQASYTRTP